MKILVNCHSFDGEQPQGVNTYIEGLYKSLLRQREDVELVLAAGDTDRLRGIFGDSDRVKYVGLKSRSRLWRLMAEFPSVIRREKPDFAHFQYICPPVKACPYILTIHDILFEEFKHFFSRTYRLPRHFLFKSSARRADLLFTVSDYSRRKIEEIYGVESSRIGITPNGVSPDFGRIDRECSRAKILGKYGVEGYLLYVSRLEPRKNHAGLLRAYSNLRMWERGKDLVLIGSRTLPVPEFDAMMSSLSPEVRSHVHHFENVPQNELLDWYGGAGMFVYPSLAEGFGIPPVEAGAAGVPTLCSNLTAMSDFSFFAPYHVDVSDQAAMEEGIGRLENSGDEARLASIQKEILRRYDWDRVARDFYDRLLKL